MIKIVSKNDLVTCINKVRNAGDKERSNDKYKQASVLVLFINDEIKQNSSILMIKRVPINSSHDFMKTVNYKLQGNLDLKYFNEKGCELAIHKWKFTALKKEHDKQR